MNHRSRQALDATRRALNRNICAEQTRVDVCQARLSNAGLAFHNSGIPYFIETASAIAMSLFKATQLLYLMLPAFLANMAPPFVKYWPGWNRPISERWLGTHKTFIGFAFGIAVAIVTVFVQSRINWDGALVSYASWPLLGLAIGFGAMSGDAVKSLLKRRLGIAPGEPWIPSDQLDYVMGALVFMWFWIRLSWQDVLLVFAIGFVGHIAVNHIACWLGIRDTRW